MPSECPRCGAAIIWAETTKLRRMPVNAMPDPAGRFVLSYDPVGGPPCAFPKMFADGDEDAFVPHWGTCGKG